MDYKYLGGAYSGWPFYIDDDEETDDNVNEKKEDDHLDHDCAFHFSKIANACLKCQPEKDPRNRKDLWGITANSK